MRMDKLVIHSWPKGGRSQGGWLMCLPISPRQFSTASKKSGNNATPSRKTSLLPTYVNHEAALCPHPHRPRSNIRLTIMPHICCCAVCPCSIFQPHLQGLHPIGVMVNSIVGVSLRHGAEVLDGCWLPIAPASGDSDASDAVLWMM
jgi:hypothetical protein